ncbi:hypothetical protein [Nonomuraea sp. NPDC049646]|uniref:hypothetical protein n=1 Tax=unclassified Nonomuraea TaxID=2593643 RepID=UPI00378AEAE4
MSSKARKQQRRHYDRVRAARTYAATADRMRIERTLAEARQATPELVAVLATKDEVWSVGPLMCVLPPLLDEFPDELKQVVDRRRRATLTCTCDCGGMVRWVRPNVAELRHIGDCPATDENMTALGAKHGIPFVRWA